MGLNESYGAVQGQILLLDPLPSINKFFSLVLQEERQRENTPQTNEVAALLAKSGSYHHAPERDSRRTPKQNHNPKRFTA